MTTLAQLQQEWREQARRAMAVSEKRALEAFSWCADALTPFVAQESAQAAQREADTDLIRKLVACIEDGERHAYKAEYEAAQCEHCAAYQAALVRLSEDNSGNEGSALNEGEKHE